MKKFEIIDHTADIGLIAWGKSIEELFANAALGMFHIIANQKDLENAKRDFEEEVNVEAIDYEALLVNWLNELLYLFEVKKVLLNYFVVESMGQCFIKAKVAGSRVGFKDQRILRCIKACTYYQTKIEEVRPGLFRAQVYFDI